MFFSVITKNLNWEILFLKDGTGLRMKNFNVIGTRRNCLKVVGGGWLGHFAELGRGAR